MGSWNWLKKIKKNQYAQHKIATKTYLLCKDKGDLNMSRDWSPSPWGVLFLPSTGGGVNGDPPRTFNLGLGRSIDLEGIQKS